MGNGQGTGLVSNLLAPLTDKLQNEGYHLSVQFGGTNKRVLDLVKRYNLDQVHQAFLATRLEWRMLAPHESDQRLQIDFLSQSGLNAESIEVVLAPFGTVDHRVYKVGSDVIDEFRVTGHPHVLTEIYEGLIYLDETYHKKEFHYSYDSAWQRSSF